MISGAVSGFVESLSSGTRNDSRGPGEDDIQRRNDEWNDNERWSTSDRWNDTERRINTQRLNDNARSNDNYRSSSSRGRNERSSRTPSYRLSKDDLRNIAFSTLQILDEGEYFPPGQDGPYDLKTKIWWTNENTRYYGPDAGEDGEILESEFIKINEEGGDETEAGKQDEVVKDDNAGAGEETDDAGSLDEIEQGEHQSEKVASEAMNKPTKIFVGECSTLVGARRVHFALAANLDSSANKKIGVLNFASAKKPGGGFINGSQAQVRFFFLTLYMYMLLNEHVNQEESLARSSTLFPSLAHAGSQFYTHHQQDPSNAYYTHAMVYSPGVVFLRDDVGEWRSPVEVDVLTSAAVNAGEIRRELEREERLRRERAEMEIWKKMAEKRRKANEKAMAEKRKLKEENAKLRKKQEERKEQAKLAKSQRGRVESGDENEMKETDEGKTKGSDSEKEERSVEQEEADAEVENEKERGKEAEVQKPEENQEEIAVDNPEPESESSSDSQLTDAGENEESKGTLIQDDQPQLEAPPEVSQEPTSSSTIAHPLSPQTQPSRAPNPDPDLAYDLAVSNAENKIYHTMYARISRILHLFQLHQTPHLILGSFGTGVFQNRIEFIASIFANLLVKPGGRFKNVFQTVMFAILGKETVRVFMDVFTKVDKQAQRERKCKRCVFKDDVEGGDGDVREREDQRMMRLMKWDARRNVILNAAQDAADAASLAAAQVDAAAFDEADAALYPPSFDTAQDTAVCSPFHIPEASAVPCAVSSATVQADAAAYLAPFDTAQNGAVFYSPSFDVPQATAIPSFATAQVDAASYPFSNATHASATPPPFHATQAGVVPYPTVQADAAAARATVAFSVRRANPTAADTYGIPGDEKMMLTRRDEQVDLVAEATTTTPMAMTVDEDRDIEMVKINSLSARSREAHARDDDDDIEMQ